MPRRRLRFVIIATVFTLSFVACSNSTTAPSGTTINVTGLSALTIGQIAQLAATEDPLSGNPTDISKTATWSSADASIASISSTGLLTAVAAGSTTISA